MLETTKKLTNRFKVNSMINWYVMSCKARKEAFLRERLQIQRIEVYLPSVRVRPINPRARKEQPFFPGYLFVHVDLEQISASALRWIPGSNGLVCYGGEPAQVGDALVREIQKQVDGINDSANSYVDRFRPGDLVVINDGPFATYKAMFDCRLSGSDRVRVLLELLQGQNMRLELSGRQLQVVTP
jgi:transcriptional antiterminator RfaH